MREITPEEEAVIDAAEKYYQLLCGRCTNPDEVALVKSVEALRASRAPKGVRPETVEPGTRFRFVEYDGNNAAIMMRHDAKPAFRWDDEDPNVCRSFMPCDSMVIPIQEEEGGECEHPNAERLIEGCGGSWCPDCKKYGP